MKKIIYPIILIMICSISYATIDNITLEIKNNHINIINNSAIITTLLYQNNMPIIDGQCEIDIFRYDGLHVVDFRSALSQDNGEYKYLWTNIISGNYTMIEYCTYGYILNDNRIYLYIDIEVI